MTNEAESKPCVPPPCPEPQEVTVELILDDKPLPVPKGVDPDACPTCFGSHACDLPVEHEGDHYCEPGDLDADPDDYCMRWSEGARGIFKAPRYVW